MFNTYCNYFLNKNIIVINVNSFLYLNTIKY